MPEICRFLGIVISALPLNFYQKKQEIQAVVFIK